MTTNRSRSIDPISHRISNGPSHERFLLVESDLLRIVGTPAMSVGQLRAWLLPTGKRSGALKKKGGRWVFWVREKTELGSFWCPNFTLPAVRWKTIRRRFLLVSHVIPKMGAWTAHNACTKLNRTLPASTASGLLPLARGEESASRSTSWGSKSSRSTWRGELNSGCCCFQGNPVRHNFVMAPPLTHTHLLHKLYFN